MTHWLVVTGTWLLFFHILEIIIPIDFHIFQGDWNHQSAQVASGSFSLSSTDSTNSAPSPAGTCGSGSKGWLQVSRPQCSILWIWWFPDIGVPLVFIHFRLGCSWIFQNKPSIVGYPHFRKPPYDVKFIPSDQAMGEVWLQQEGGSKPPIRSQCWLKVGYPWLSQAIIISSIPVPYIYAGKSPRVGQTLGLPLGGWLVQWLGWYPVKVHSGPIIDSAFSITSSVESNHRSEFSWLKSWGFEKCLVGWVFPPS